MESQTPTSPPPLKRAPNISDVAAALGMHKSTVSLGLSGKGNISAKTRARIEAVAREMGYQPNPLAQRLATNANNNLVCLCAGSLDVGLTTDKVLTIQKELAERGLEAPVYTLPTLGKSQGESQVSQVRQLCRQNPRAVLCSVQSVCAEVYAELERYQHEGGIVVTYDTSVPLACDQVVFDREHNAYQAAQYLIEQGHQRIGLALASPRRADGHLSQAQNARVIGFTRALQEAGLEMRPEWVFEETTYEIGGARLATDFLALNERPTAMCVVNDYMALAFMVEVMRAGVQVPQDLSIIGHDNQPIASFCPVPLTSASQPKEQIVQAVVDLLDERLKGSTQQPRTITIRGEIVERQSVTMLRS